MKGDMLQEQAPPYRADAETSPYGALADQIYRARVMRARNAAPESKVLAGQRLFEAACEITLTGIRQQNPTLSEEQCRQVLRERLAWRRCRDAHL
jgi:hypothetical protein